jgi:predicted nucleotidyltransferase
VTDDVLTSALQDLRQALDELLGDRLGELLLFGSRARGDARRGSDIDVLVVVDGEFDYADLMRRTSRVAARISLEHDVVISRVFVSRAQYESGRSPFLLNVRREAVAM